MTFKPTLIFLKMLLGKDFWKLMAICLKMLFRKSTRRRFICLVGVFLFTMAFNTWGYIRQFNESEIRRAEVLSEKAFQVFFLRLRTNSEYMRFARSYQKALANLGAGIIESAFIYQNNLFIHFGPIHHENKDLKETAGKKIDSLYRIFGIKGVVHDYALDDGNDKLKVKVNNIVINHNGKGLTREIARSREVDLKRDLADAADIIRGNKSGRRLMVFNELALRIRETVSIVSTESGGETNPYVSRVALIVPMNLLHLLTNLARDNTTDIIDFSESVEPENGSILRVEKRYLKVPAKDPFGVMYGNIDLYPRYLSVHMPVLLSSKWHWLLYKGLEINDGFMDLIERLHFKGHYLFSYEKSQIIRERIEKINTDIRANHIHFYLTDLLMSIAFPFMVSLFAFVHLKSEFAFMLMFKNRIRELLAVFWLLPLLMMLTMKSGLLAAQLFLPQAVGEIGAPDAWAMVLPMTLSFLAVSAFFYPVNRWCFSPFTGNRLNLALLHKGK